MVRVLLVDADDEARAALAGRLRRLPGIEQVEVARDSKEAGAVLKQTDPDVLLVDMHTRLWDGDAAGLCRELRAMTGAPLMVLASFMPRERWEELRAGGATTFLLKRVNTEELERELLLASARYRSPNSRA